MYKGIIVLFLLASAACGPKETANNGTNNVTTNNGTSNNTKSNNSNNAKSNNSNNSKSNNKTNNKTTTNNQTSGLVFQKVGGPCTGTRTKALWFDDANTGFIGCGTDAGGKNLYMTKDGGSTWDTIRSFKDVRVLDIRRIGGTLYVGGIEEGTDERAWSVDGTFKKTAIYSKKPNTSYVNQVENVAIRADGGAILDDLTGGAIVVREPGATEFKPVDSIGEGELKTHQVRRVRFYNDKPYATGSIQSKYPRVYLPSKTPTKFYEVTEIKLRTKSAEMMEMHLFDANAMIVVGWANGDTPLIFVGDGDLYDAKNWTEVDIFAQGLEANASAFGMSANGSKVLLVGDSQPSGHGFAFWSTDKGKTWKDITPKEMDPKAMRRAWLFDDGSAFIAGGSGNAWKVSGLK